MLKHGFITIFAFAASMIIGINGFSQVIQISSDELTAEVIGLSGTKTNVFNEGLAVDPSAYMYYSFIGFAALLLVFTLLYIRKMCKVKVKNS